MNAPSTLLEREHSHQERARARRTCIARAMPPTRGLHARQHDVPTVACGATVRDPSLLACAYFFALFFAVVCFSEDLFSKDLHLFPDATALFSAFFSTAAAFFSTLLRSEI